MPGSSGSSIVVTLPWRILLAWCMMPAPKCLGSFQGEDNEPSHARPKPKFKMECLKCQLTNKFGPDQRCEIHDDGPERFEAAAVVCRPARWAVNALPARPEFSSFGLDWAGLGSLSCCFSDCFGGARNAKNFGRKSTQAELMDG